MQTNELQSLYLQSPKLNQLNILREVCANPKVTQAELAHLCSLSVAMVNNYMKQLCCAGWIEYHRKSSKSMSYHLTPAGTSYLDSLQLDLIREMSSMFEMAKQHVRARIMSCAHCSLQRVILYGTNNLAQLAFHALQLAGVSIVGVCDENPLLNDRDFCGREVISPSQIRFIAPDAVVVAEAQKTDEICRKLAPLCELGIEIIRLDGKPETEPANTLSPNSTAAELRENATPESRSFPTPPAPHRIS
jgi:predicted transcriptional regulator